MKYLILISSVVCACGSTVVAADGFVAAAEEERWEDVRKQISQANASARQADGMTALHWAVLHQNEDVVRLLIQHEADVGVVTEYGVSPLHLACSRRNSKIVKFLLDAGAQVDVYLPGGESPLMTAARANAGEAIKLLVAASADIEHRERAGQTALMWAAAEGNVVAAEQLLKAGAKVDSASRTGFTALMFAARNGHIAVVELLHHAGADVNDVMVPKSSGGRRPRKGTSALTLAVESGHFELAMRLISLGADPNDQRSGFTPLHALTWVRKPDRGENPNGDPPPRGSGNLSALDFVRAIVEAGANVNEKLKRGRSGRAKLNHSGATPFLLASKTADLQYLKVLLELGADPSIPNDDGCNAMLAAAGIGVRAVGEEAGTEPEVIACVKWLSQLGLDVNSVDENGETIMHGAAYRSYPQLVVTLRELGANSDVWDRKNKWGWTPEMIAQGHRPGSFKPSPTMVAALKQAKKP